MRPGLLTVLAAAAILVVVVLCVLLAGSVRRRRRLERTLAASREELTALEHRIDALAHEMATSRQVPQPRVRADETEYVITTAGDRAANEVAVPGPRVQQLTARQFASVALGESLVTVFSFGYGVRRALSAENRNRIAFEMRREVRRARKQRRRELKEQRRRLRDPGMPDAA
jgi:hypothetical protein